MLSKSLLKAKLREGSVKTPKKKKLAKEKVVWVDPSIPKEIRKFERLPAYNSAYVVSHGFLKFLESFNVGDLFKLAYYTILMPPMTIGGATLSAEIHYASIGSPNSNKWNSVTLVNPNTLVMFMGVERREEATSKTESISVLRPIFLLGDRKIIINNQNLIVPI